MPIGALNIDPTFSNAYWPASKARFPIDFYASGLGLQPPSRGFSLFLVVVIRNCRYSIKTLKSVPNSSHTNYAQ